jgi:ABC-type uncharacterized transport system involved in gliding motility auxiliary subunit
MKFETKINKTELFKFLGYVGAALLISGYIRSSVREIWSGWEKGMLIVGGILLGLSIIFNFAAIKTYFSRRSTKLGTNTLVITVVVVAILIMLNFLGYRHSKRFDLTEEHLYSLSDQTHQILGQLDRDVKVMLFDKEDNPPLHDRMDEYKNLSRHISYEHIDPQAKPDVAKQHNITRLGEIIVTAGNRTERIEGTDEQDITNAILKVTRNKTKVIYFLEGHGEKSPSDTGAEGYSAVKRGLEHENYEVKPVNLVTTNQVPSDCTVLIVAGPKQSLFPQEASMIAKFLDEGGKVMALLDSDTKPEMDEVFKKWGIDVGNDTVIDVSGVGRIFGTGPAVPLVIDYGTHSITRNFDKKMSFFPLARSVKKATNTPTDLDITELLKTSPQSWAETNLNEGQIKFDEGQDTKGPVSLGVVASKKVGDKQARLVVIGDSDFASNRYVSSQLNGDLFLNSANWLAGDEDLISVRPKQPKNRRVTLTESQQNLLSLLNVIFLPGLVILSGIVIWWRRR